MSPEDLSEIEQRANAAFRGPWRYGEFAIYCGYDRCEIDACRNDPDTYAGYYHDIVSIEAPDEYPDNQYVAQIQVPGLEGFAERNGKFIAAARTDIPRLIEALRRAWAERDRAIELLREAYRLRDLGKDGWHDDVDAFLAEVDK